MTTPRLLSERYELGDTLGYGGMSEVHRGRDVRLSRDVAVKVLRADLARDPQFQLRFRREAQNAAALNHPAIVAVYDTGEVESEFGPLPYIVMEFVDGQTLREIVKGTGPLSQQRVLEVMADVCAALDFSHRHGIIHRDVKPANVMITQGGAVKVMDFGIARALADNQNMTQTAAVIGTAQYLSPEQARGEAVDARSDVYAAGCVLFELLTGEPPFSGDSPVAVAYQHVREDPRKPSEVDSSVTPELDSIVLKAISKNPANRYQSAAEMRSDLVRVLRGQRPLAPTVMSEDERTALMTGGPGPAAAAGGAIGTRRLTSSGTRHAAPANWNGSSGRRRPGGRGVAMAVGAAAVLGLILFVATKLFGGVSAPEMVAVPDVSSQRQEAASTQLRDLGFKPSIVSTASPDNPQIPVGQAIRTDPAAGAKVATGTRVTLYISTGPAQVIVPDLSGKNQADAQQQLTTTSLVMAQPPSFAPTADPNLVDKVISQNPKPGASVPGQTPVTITIGQKQTGVKMPTDLIGRSEDDARKELEGMGLTVNTTRVDGPGTEGTVFDIDPKAGTLVPQRGTVNLMISRGNKTGTLPPVIGLSESDAKRALKDSGVRSSNIHIEYSTVKDQSQDRKVLEQSPEQDSSFDDDTEVTLTVGQY